MPHHINALSKFVPDASRLSLLDELGNGIGTHLELAKVWTVPPSASRQSDVPSEGSTARQAGASHSSPSHAHNGGTNRD